MPINESFILKTVGKENMIIPLAEGGVDFSKVYNVSETGAFIFKLLIENKSVEEIASSLVNEYEVSLDIAAKDTVRFIEVLKERGIYYD